MVGSLLAAAVPLAAQEVLVTPGARIRVTLRSAERLSGMLSASNRDSLLLQARGPSAVEPRSIALADIERLERSLGKRHRYGKGILLGTAIGGGIGVLLGVAYPLCEPTGEGLFECLFEFTDRGEAVRFNAVGGAVTGALIGIIVAAVGRENWQPASLPAMQPTISAGRSGLEIGFRLPMQL